MSTNLPILIVGAGQAGATAMATLRSLGYTGQIVLAGEEPHLPYERPPLSKSVLRRPEMEGQIAIHPTAFQAGHDLDLRLGASVTAIDPVGRLAHFSDGKSLVFSRCLLATGGTIRTLEALPPGTPRVHYLRTLDDARALRTAMQHESSIMILGAGFLGLEVASTARDMGLDVTVLEAGSRVLARALPPELSAWLERRVRHNQVDLRLDCRVATITPQSDAIAFTFDDGRQLRAPLVVVAIGQVPNVSLAHSSGLALHPLNQGIRIDAKGRSSAPDIYAAGDCASQFQPLFGEEMRLESWQSANEQARVAASSMLDADVAPAALPWFWTDQFGCNLQILGFPSAGLSYAVRGDMTDEDTAPKFLLLGFQDERLRHAIAVNAGMDLRQLRALIEQQVPCDPERLRDTSIPLRQLVRDATASQTVIS
ncbi:MAG: NAD(P)/FAD-dependent oxidoreductase [Longimicrobiales bacterium]